MIAGARRVARGRARSGSCSTPPAASTRAGPACASRRRSRPRSRARSRSRWPAACTPANVADALLAIPATGVDVASGTDAPRVDGRASAQGPVPGRPVRQARPGRPPHRPNVAFGPDARRTPGLLEVDGAGRWGMERDFGGRYVPETLVAALEQLEAAYDAVRHDPRFWAELDDLLGRFAGRPTAALSGRPPGRGGGRGGAAPRGRRRERSPPLAVHRDPGLPPVPQARGPRPHRRPQDQQRARPGAADAAARQDPGHRRDRRRPARRRDRHGVRAARAAVRRVHGRGGHPTPGPERAPDARPRRRGALRDRGTATLKDAVNEAMRDWVTNVETTHYVLGSAMGPHPYPTIVRDLQRRIGDEAAAQLAGRRGAAARPRPRLRRRRLQRHRPAVAVHRRAVGAARGGRGGRATASRPGGTRRRSRAARRASSTARAR